MIARAIERGVSSADIADALGLQSPSFAGSVCWKASARGSRDAERHALLDEGVRCPAADERRSANRSGRFDDRSAQFYAYVRASDTRCHASQPVGRSQKDDRRCCIHAARPADCSHGKGTGSTSDSSEKRRGTYGIDNLHLTVARGYVAKLLANTRITRWLSYHRQEYLGEFQKIAEIDAIGPQPEAPEA
ncbi:plasmid partitioning protein RepB C-terminal domain-containing protein [Sinorhizobium meliloti]|uniref:plasmid partitioning protein RepB C-terminal domain-containing protein n=3 Tax=Rhizobium meliloti TaxID=382 RepID=UPI0023808DBB|nr:plasmid partitioning protein RepB C-terminal domain-containing protein [Sinorhizobium meliloti]